MKILLHINFNVKFCEFVRQKKIGKDECTDYRGGASEKHHVAKVKDCIVFHQHVYRTLVDGLKLVFYLLSFG